MRKLIFSLVAAAALTGLMTGCASSQQKLSRGMSNTFEVVRWGDLRHDVEQDAIFSTPGVSYSGGMVRGFCQSVTRIGVGVYEVVTFPIPSYKPAFTNYLPVAPQYPTSYQPGVISGSTFDTDTYTGFSGGDVFPFIPGSRFQIFDN